MKEVLFALLLTIGFFILVGILVVLLFVFFNNPILGGCLTFLVIFIAFYFSTKEL